MALRSCASDFGPQVSRYIARSQNVCDERAAGGGGHSVVRPAKKRNRLWIAVAARCRRSDVPSKEVRVLPQGLEHERHVVAVAASARVLAGAPRKTGLHLLKDAKREPSPRRHRAQLQCNLKLNFTPPTTPHSAPLEAPQPGLKLGTPGPDSRRICQLDQVPLAGRSSRSRGSGAALRARPGGIGAAVFKWWPGVR